MRGSRNKVGNPKNDDFYTPKWVFDQMGLHFDLDVCAPEGGTGLVPADKHYSLKDDGLTSPWHGRVWMNPPYSKPTPWIEKFIEHGNGVALVPTSKAAWFSSIWNESDAIKLMNPKFKFERPDGERKDIFMPLVLVALGKENVDAIAKVDGNAVLTRAFTNEIDRYDMLQL